VSAPGWAEGADIKDTSKRRGVVEVAALGLTLPPLNSVAVAPLAGAFDLGGGELQNGAPTSSASISVTERLSPSGVSQLRWRSRPVTITRSPLERESARCSACPRQTLTRRKLMSPSLHSPSCQMGWVTATRRLATAMPVLVNCSC
jgi:hypothetical protein